MKIINTKFSGLKIYKKDSINDKRGYTRELFFNKLITLDIFLTLIIGTVSAAPAATFFDVSLNFAKS